MIKKILPIRDLYKTQQLPVIKDVFDEKYYLRYSEMDKNFNVEVCFGRPVYSTVGRAKIIVTQDLKDFILNSLAVPGADFNDVLTKGSVGRLRRLLRNNPYKSYRQWVSSTHAGKPDFITFYDARNKPELIKDCFDREYVILSARLVKKTGLAFPIGVHKKSFDENNKATPRYILTPEIAEILKEHRLYPRKTKDMFPFGEQTISSLLSYLGYSVYPDRRAFLAENLQNILNSTVNDFCSRFDETMASRHAIRDVKSGAVFILETIKKQPFPVLITLLEKYWETPTDDIRKTIDDFVGTNKSKQLRRAFDLLKIANFI